MIDLNLPEPEIKECVFCFRKHGNLKGILIHWPNKDCTKKTVGYPVPIEPFSIWLYTCRWCRGIHTKLKNKIANKPLHADPKSTNDLGK